MDEYRKTIQQLDTPHAMVQIEASIIDVDADHGFEFGPPLQGIWRRNGTTRSASARIDTPAGGAPPIGVTASSGNLTLSLTASGVTEFMTNLQALETEGHARIVSKPSVLTLDNIEAFLNESEEFFVRVAGFEQADLFNVNVGTTMRIIPHIVYEPASRKVKLNISLEDGSRSAVASVDEIPVVSRNTINTQAVLMEGQSLLIGGLMREATSKVERRVPVIGRLPVIGHLAKTHDNETIRLERMVLLTPTIVELPTATDRSIDPAFERGIGPLPVPIEQPQLMPAAEPIFAPTLENEFQQESNLGSIEASRSVDSNLMPASLVVDAFDNSGTVSHAAVSAHTEMGPLRADPELLEAPTEKLFEAPLPPMETPLGF